MYCRDAGYNKIHGYEQHAADSYQPHDEKHAVYYIFDQIVILRFLTLHRKVLSMRRKAVDIGRLQAGVFQFAATAPAAEMMSAASAERAKSKNFCAVAENAVPSLVTRTNGRWMM